MSLPVASASPALARVPRGDLCAGCGICAGLGQTLEAAGRADSALWGPYVTMCTVTEDPAVRHAGSSGGALTALLGHLLATGRVDAVLQTAADLVFPIGNETVITTDAAAILNAAGSRYAPSAPLAGLAGPMADGRRFAFVGKPCDAAALRALAGRDPDVARVFPVILSFFCARVPSHEGGRKVLEALGTDLDHNLRFRFRGDGWPDEAGGILSKHVQHRCNICADGAGAAADLVCADAWETDAQGDPLFADRPGVSLIVARTALGADFLTEAEAAAIIETQNFALARLAAIQPGQRERRRALAARLAALKLLGRPIPDYRGLKLLEAGRQNSVGRLVRNSLGTLRRGLKQ